MIAYPIVTIVKSFAPLARGTPAAITSAPAICTRTASRYGTSSVSNADANHVKFIHAHQSAKKTIAKPRIASP